jgi:hypothetical protein
MPRKIFISFLGAIPYFPTRYYLRGDRADLTEGMYYAQETILRSHPVDEALIFTTKEARRNNYEARIYRQGQQSHWAEGEGLESVLRRLKAEGMVGAYRPIMIPNGHDEEEIWRVFQLVFAELAEEDEVVFDITFGFRSLPMLVMVLLNYARNLRQVRVKAVYYGNYEAGRAEKEERLKLAEDEAEQNRIQQQLTEAPILDLMPFAVLQDWTYAAQAFSDGNVAPLARLAAESQPGFSQRLAAFARAVQTCRGQALCTDIDVDELKDFVQSLSAQSDIAVQLQPLLDKVSRKLAPFASRQLANGFAAVEWCIQHGMVQQGITFLQETLQSYVVENTAGTELICSRIHRAAANTALNGYTTPKVPLRQNELAGYPLTDEEVKDFCRAMNEFVRRFPGLVEAYKALTGEFRNDINHCGFRLPYAQPETLNEELTQIYGQIKNMGLVPDKL